MTRRIFSTICFVAMVVLISCLVLVMGVLYSYFNQVQWQQLTNQTEILSQGLEAIGPDYLSNLKLDSGRITWIAADGTVLYDTQNATSENHLQREEIREALETGYGQSKRYSDTIMAQSCYSAKRLSDGSVLRTSMEERTAVLLAVGMIQPVCIVFLATIGLAMFLAARLSKHVVKPLNEINLDNPLSAETYPEITPLLRRLDSQQKQLHRQEWELHHRQDQLQTVIKNMSEGLVLLNREGSVLSINPAAMDQLGIVGSCSINEALNRSEQVREMVMKSLDGCGSECVLQLPGGQFQVDANPVESNGAVSGAVLLIFDMTETQKSEVMRREFTANVSHELKTPLHSISGYAELLYRNMVRPEDVASFSEKIYSESQRMIKLVEDIIRLSRLDEGAEMMPWAQVDLMDITANVVKDLQDVAAAANVELLLEGSHTNVYGISQLLSTAITNLCDNAVKYNRKGGKAIIIIGEDEHSSWITVKDTGIGIPKEHQSRIFERFYRVDKSHSKAVGGTGLGLSIVKHTATIHHAAVELESVPQVGTSVTLRFSKQYTEE